MNSVCSKGFCFVALGLALVVPAGPALAAPNLGPDWVLIETRKVGQFVLPPPKLQNKGKGKWKVKAVRDRKYFVPRTVVATTEESTLDSSRVLNEVTDRTPETHALETVAGEASVKEKQYEEIAARATARRTEGRFLKTFGVTTVKKMKETTTTTPFQTFDNVSWEERSRKTLRNVYRVKTNLTLKDPITKQTLETQAQRLNPPVVEIALGKWEQKAARRAGPRGAEITTANSVVGTRLDEKLLASAAAPAADPPQDTVGVSSAGLAYSTGALLGAGASRVAPNSDKLIGAGKTRAAGGAKFESDELLAAAKAGAKLVDDRGATWTLQADGTTLLFTPAGGETARLDPGLRRAEAGDVEVRLDSAIVRDGAVTLSGKFRHGRDRAQTLRTP